MEPTATEQSAESPPRPVRVQRLLMIAVWVIILVLVLQFFDTFKVLFLGVLAAVSLASAVSPLMRKMSGPRVLRAVIAGIVPVLSLVLIIWLISWQLSEPLQRELGQWPRLEQELNGLLADWSSNLGIRDPLTFNDIISNIGEFFTGHTVDIMSTTAGALVGAIIALAFVLFGTIYLLVERQGALINPLLKFLPPRRRNQLEMALIELEPLLRHWLIGTLASMVIIGSATWIGYRIIGLNFAGPLAIFAGFSEIVPTIGPTLALLVALMAAATQDSSVLIGVLILYLIIQTIESHIVLPLIMRRAVHIPPFVTLFSIVLWGEIFGLAGILLAIPINLVIWTFANAFLETYPEDGHVHEHYRSPSPLAGKKGSPT